MVISPESGVAIIQDSGVREDFATGSVRDTRKGKGRFDLIAALAPPHFSLLGPTYGFVAGEEAINLQLAFVYMYMYLASPEQKALQSAFDAIVGTINGPGPNTYAHLDRLARHYEAGAAKYNDRNWEKGQEIMRYFDSACRHIVRALQGRTDEDHMSAALWNIIAIPHTLEMIKRGILPATLDDRPDYTPHILVPKNVESRNL